MFRPSAAFVTVLLVLSSSAWAADPLAPPGMVSASEADFVPEEPPSMPVFTWTGPYVGLDLGYGFGRDRAAARVGGTAGQRNVIASSSDGIVGGGHAGYLLSLKDVAGIGAPSAGAGLIGATVIGLEGEIDGTDLKSKGFAPGMPTGLDVATARSNVEGSLRARLGVAAQRVLVYGTGGIAFADFKTSDGFTGSTPEGFSHTRAGYTLGGGVEWALLNSVSVRAEYRYSDFGHSVDPTGPAVVPVVHHDSTQRLQTGLSYHFGGSTVPPAAAR